MASGNLSNVPFRDLLDLMDGFGFVLVRRKGSHHILRNPSVGAIVNIQNVNGEAKPYQIRQALAIVEKHRLRLEADE
jgi:predicted RNA binding protein YcfA (HicA-like mRNA interferase family)